MTSSLSAQLKIAEPSLALVQDLLRLSARVLITTHRHPDGDAVGSVLALAKALRTRGLTVTTHAPDPAPSFLHFLPGAAALTAMAEPISTYDLTFALDHSELDRVGLAEELLAARRPLVSIDHHATSDRRATVALVFPEAAATAEILEALLPLLDFPIDAETATCLLTGLATDTGFFQHANTSGDVLRAAGRLLERGADLRAIVRHAGSERSLHALRIAGRALARLTLNPQTGVVVSLVTREDLDVCGATLSDLTGVTNLLNTIPEASFSLLLTEEEAGTVKGSLRSEPRAAVDVSAIARRFGGGGHRLASGFEVAGRLVRDATGWHVA